MKTNKEFIDEFLSEIEEYVTQNSDELTPTEIREAFGRIWDCCCNLRNLIFKAADSRCNYEKKAGEK